VCLLCIISGNLRKDTSSLEIGTGCAKLEGTAYEVAVIVQHSDAVCLQGEPPQHSLATMDLLGRLSLSLLLSRVSPLEPEEKL
jgi:hypothetical protein